MVHGTAVSRALSNPQFDGVFLANSPRFGFQSLLHLMQVKRRMVPKTVAILDTCRNR
jgi:hypothetical protein